MEDQLRDDILQLIDNDKVLKLRDLYLKDWPKYSPIYYHINMTHTWMTEYNEDFKFYGVEGNFDDGTVIIITKEPGCEEIKLSYYTLDKSNSRLYNALSKTRRIDWSKEIRPDMISRDQLSVTFDIAKERRQHLFGLCTTAFWWLPKEKALKFEIEIPNNTFIDSLSLEHAAKIHKAWPFNVNRPIEYIAALIKNNNGIGILDKNDKTLMAWILLSDYGALGILQTDEKYMRRGYAKIVTKALCKKLANNNVDSLSFIVVGNTVSEKLFENLGFKIVDYLNWVGMKPSCNIYNN